MNRTALTSLNRDDLVAFVLAQHAQIEAPLQQIGTLTAPIAELEAKLANPPKTPDNSSLPPSKGEKLNLPDRSKKKRRPGRPGVTRALAERPDRTIEATLAACPHCDHTLGPADMTDVHAYDHIDLPPIRPVMTRINRHRGVCPCCRQRVSAPAPEGFAPGSPFGPGIEALIIHLHITQAISFERLARLMDEVFGLSISEGAVANILARAQTPLLAAAETIAAAVRASPVVGSDETSARVCGATWWQWVLLSSTAICHVIADTRAASVVSTFLRGITLEVWVADRYGGPLGHGAVRQMCLAHLLRDAQYAIDAGDTVFAPGFKHLLLRAVAIGKRRATLKDTTLAHYHAGLERRLDKLLSGPQPKQKSARCLFQAMRRDRDDLFRFITRRAVPYSRVDDWRGGGRSRGVAVVRRLSPVAGALFPWTLAPFPVAARQTGRADFPHPAFSRPVKPSLSAGRCVVAGRRTSRASHRDTRPGSGRTRRHYVPLAAATSDGHAAPCICG